MRSKWMGVAALALTILASAGAWVSADEAPPKDQPAEKIAMVATVKPNELRSYSVSVAITGCVGILDTGPLTVDAVNTMKVTHQYGHREGDGLLQLDISASDAQATINGEKSPAAPDQFPKLTLLLDKSWKVNKMFGIEGTRYEGQVPGLNYANLILLYYVPDADKPHAIGEIWTNKVKLPGKMDEVTIKSTLRSVTAADANKVVSIHQEYVWGEQKLEAGMSVKSTAAVDSTFDIATGKLLKSHAECQLPFSDPSQTKPENRQYKATSKIGITLNK